MRLGLIASEMEGEPTGVGRFVEGLLTGLARSGADGEIHLFFRGRDFEHPLWSDPRFRLHFAGRPDRSPVVWEQILLPGTLRRVPLDVLCGPAYSLPPRLRCPAMVAIHDLSFELLPEEFGARERLRRRLLARSAARRAERVLTISRQVARQIAERYGVAAERIDVLPVAVDAAGAAARPAHGFSRSGGDERGEREGGEPGAALPAPPYLVYLGSILPRRRVDLLLAAFAGLARDRPGLKLVLAGSNRLPRPGELHEQIARLGLGERVVELGWVAESQREALLAGAEVSFYLSSYEGYGLPPLESLAAGTAAVVSAGLGLDELWPDYPLRCERLDAPAIERVARAALDDAALRRAVVERGRELVGALTWEACAQRFLESARRAIGGRTVAGAAGSPSGEAQP